MDPGARQPALRHRQGRQAAGQEPVQDARVRAAISKALNRDAIVSRIMEGLAVPASSIVSPQIFGHPGTRPDAYDRKAPEAAGRRRLPRRFRPDPARHQQPLPERRGGGAGHRRHADAHRHPDQGGDDAGGRLLHARAGRVRLRDAGLGLGGGRCGATLHPGTPNPKTGYGTELGQVQQPAARPADREIADHGQQRQGSRRERPRGGRFALADHGIIPSHSQLAMWAMRRACATKRARTSGRSPSSSTRNSWRPRPVRRGSRRAGSRPACGRGPRRHA